MRCHFVKGDNGERVLIPWCWSNLYGDDLENCTCPQTHKQSKVQVSMDKIEQIACELNSPKGREIMGLIRQVREVVEQFDKS